jgi:hypothetical protein
LKDYAIYLVDLRDYDLGSRGVTRVSLTEPAGEEKIVMTRGETLNL